MKKLYNQIDAELLSIGEDPEQAKGNSSRLTATEILELQMLFQEQIYVISGGW